MIPSLRDVLQGTVAATVLAADKPSIAQTARLDDFSIDAAETPYGDYERLASLVKLSRTPTHWREPLLEVRGAARPTWDT